MRVRGIATAASVLVLAGCATAPPGQDIANVGRSQLANTPTCCTTLATAASEALPREKASLVVDQSRQVFDFSGTKSYFVMFQLPAFSQPYAVTITSVPRGTLSDMAILVPRVETYDAEFRKRRSFDEKSLRNRGTSLERTIFVNPQDAAERYLCVFGADLSGTVSHTYSAVDSTPLVAGPMTIFIHNGRDAKSSITASPTGNLVIETQGL